ncbi:MAG: transcriptional regulator NanR [Acidobacteria bacterium]|nr:transcriptional regulator NanR [Acidobacteriota bacterium]
MQPEFCGSAKINGSVTKHVSALIEEPPVSRRKLADEILDRLIRLIESGSILPGEQLPSERELMAVYGVGRPAVREALQSLQKLGMISINHGERARVISITPDTLFEQLRLTARHLLSSSAEMLDHLKEARLMFEQAMVRRAARDATDADRERLREVLAGMSGKGKSTNEFIQSDMAFHETIASISGNPLFAAISKAMLDWLTHFSIPTVHQPGAEDLTIAEHTAVYNRIAARDEAGAAKAMFDHLTRANELYRTLHRGRRSRKPSRGKAAG